MSQMIEEINKIKSNRVIVWKNDKLYTILGSVGGLILILMIIGSCIIVIKYNLRGNTQSKCIKMKYFKGNSDKDIDPGRVVACVDIDGPNEAEPALLGGSGNQHLQLPVHGYQAWSINKKYVNALNSTEEQCGSMGNGKSSSGPSPTRT